MKRKTFLLEPARNMVNVVVYVVINLAGALAGHAKKDLNASVKLTQTGMAREFACKVKFYSQFSCTI